MDDFILGDRIALVMEMSIVQVLSVEGEADVRIADFTGHGCIYLIVSLLNIHVMSRYI